jgi:hypothetical protein
MTFNKTAETIWGESSLMVLKPIKGEIRPERNMAIRNFFNHYRFALQIIKVACFFTVFVYYAICALYILYASVLLIVVFIEVTGKYIS